MNVEEGLKVLVAEGTSKKGTDTKDTYSLLSFWSISKDKKMSVDKKNIFSYARNDLESFFKKNDIKSYRKNPDLELVMCKEKKAFMK